jgi:hypothetical protein
MSFWSRFDERKSGGPPIGGSGAEPIPPFEWWDPDSEKLGLGRQIVRPFTNELQHRTMRDAFFEADPLLMSALQPRQTIGEAFVDLFAQAASNCRWNGLWDSALLELPALRPYLQGMLEHMVATTHPNDEVDLWVIRMPPPKAITDAHYLALCVPRADPGLSAPIAGRRYFTLERSDAGPDWNFFCEWTSEHEHRTYDGRERMTSLAFVQIVLERFRET